MVMGKQVLLSGHGPLLADGTYMKGKVGMDGNVQGADGATTGYDAGM
jgi:hypothetical protein